jgi:hypothetical protein
MEISSPSNLEGIKEMKCNAIEKIEDKTRRLIERK